MDGRFVKSFDENSGNILLQNIGWQNALISNNIIDENGEIMPWYCYSAVHFISSKINNTISIFEYGAGFSSIFYAKRCKKVCSIETKIDVKNEIDQFALKSNIANLNITLQEDQELFADEINKIDFTPDIVVVDSFKRHECIIQSINVVNEKGVIILDNSERVQYQRSFDLMSSNGYKHITFKGIKPQCLNFSYTTIFYKQNNIFDI